MTAKRLIGPMLTDKVPSLNRMPPVASAESPAKKATGTSADVKVIDCVGKPEFKPDSLATNCTQPDQRVTDISWTEWTDDAASGVGKNADGDEVSVELSAPMSDGAQDVFTSVIIDGTVVVS